MRVIGLIPARGGSKGLPGKNLYPLQGRPLIDYTIDAARDSGILEEIWVSTDDAKIKGHVLSKRVAVIDRPDEISGDDSLTSDAVKHFILTSGIDPDDIIVLLQPTSPLRQAFDIRDAFRIFVQSQPSMVISVFEPKESPLKSFILDDSGFLKPAFSGAAPFMPRQKLPKTFYANGAIYIFSVRSFLKENGFPTSNIMPYIMPADRSIDIDRLEDIRKIERH